ncbi:hypothetical protein FB45DRAFT_876609 [Roridomyces roridus]|uniref:Uncharacterized protein n=1 Tax=Roridomyces roridus TaxID=1738132 RepID=A0AAD7FAV8_9AGAR|nr:hypothetical protein FB45DRAFT_876609 [Roridomyces roridus]
MNTPLGIPELIDQIVGSVATTYDLHACALIGRNWVHPAQSRIFSRISAAAGITQHGRRSLIRILAVFRQSPHLATFVDTLSVSFLGGAVSLRIIDDLSFCRFTSLRDLSLELLSTLPAELLRPVKTLLGIPSLTAVTLSFQFETLDDLVYVWRTSSRGIRRVQFIKADSVKPGGNSLETSGLNTRIVQPDVFRGMDWWLDDPRSPFDLSRLRAFWCTRITATNTPPRYLLTAARNAIELVCAEVCFPQFIPLAVLTGTSQTSFYPMNLSIFERVTQLEIRTRTWAEFSVTIDTINTLTPHARAQIRAFRLRLFRIEVPMAEVGRSIAEVLVTLPNLRVIVIVGITPTPTLVQSVEECFPFLDPKVLLRWRVWRFFFSFVPTAEGRDRF